MTFENDAENETPRSQADDFTAWTRSQRKIRTET